MSKKIYTITFQNAYNYGGTLQCFSLQKTIENLGYDTEILNYKNPTIDNAYKIFYKPSGNLIYLKYIKSFLKGTKYFFKIYNRNKNYKKFLIENLKLSKELTKNDIINYHFNDETILVSGSDQIWNTTITNGFDDIYFLNFAFNTKHISYAASIGKNNIEPRDKVKISQSLQHFSNISVREITAKNILNKNIKIKQNISVVLDPVFLLEKKDWESYIKNISKKSFKYIFVYMEDENVIKIAKMISKEKKLKILYISKKHIFGINSKNMFCVNPFEFLNLIKNAEYVVTSSFHATAFSLIFNKNFWVSIPNEVGSRIADLTKNFNIENRIIYKNSNLNNYNLYEEIKYENINNLIEEKRKESINWLKNSLK